MSKKITIVNNLQEFLDSRGCGDNPWQWARAFYKYTDCGPWAVFIMRDQPARVDKWSIIVRREPNGKLYTFPVSGELPPLDVLRRFGFNEQGLPNKEDREFMSSLKKYQKALEDYRERLGKNDDLAFNIWPGPTNPSPGELQHILIGITIPKTETYTEIYYEDIGRKNDKGEETVVDLDRCAGIKFGSIVEGSEAYSGPFTHMFPFDTEAFDRDVHYMEEETSFYWERDNSQWYQVLVGEKHYFCHNTWGEIKWDEPLPSAKLRKKIEAFINEHFDDIPHEVHCWGKPNPDWKPASIPGSRAEIWECYNDTTF